MSKLLQVLSYLALAGIVIPPILYFAEELSHAHLKTVMLVASVLWFATAPVWMNRRSKA